MKEKYQKIRHQSANICEPLRVEDYVVQPIVDVSPPKWHLGHTTWFFETFILAPEKKGYRLYDPDFGYVFNSYYESVGKRVLRTDRGNLTRPTVEEVISYREHVDREMFDYLDSNPELNDELRYKLELGLQHEQQHQELLFYDIKYILGHNPLFPAYIKSAQTDIFQTKSNPLNYIEVERSNYEIGTDDSEFHFDNEEGLHTVFLHDFAISDRLVSNGEYLEFIESGGYKFFQFWLSEGWTWVNETQCKSPLYWHKIENEWYQYTLHGLQKLNLDEPVAHVSFYEADAFARWKGLRLATEFEWEVACKFHQKTPLDQCNFVEREFHKSGFDESNYQLFGDLWEWTSSAYLPYPFFNPSSGAIGEYNGKFMINQKVLRGGSYATPQDHIRPTYRNFFHPHLQWHFAGIRLAKHL
ncbi:MAG: ergothioneine biosynthesis protein EgtB [Cyclobacteriaceae bacterium]